MSSRTNSLFHQEPIHRHPAIASRWTFRRRRRRQRLPTARLGGRKPRRGFSLVGICRKAKLKWMRMKYMSLLKKLEKYYASFVKDLIEGEGAIESFQQRMLLETSFAIPVMGLSFNSCTPSCPLERPIF